MQYKHIPLKDFIKGYNPTAPTDSELAEFRKTLEHMLKEGSKKILEDEDSQLGEIQRMLEKAFGYGVKKVKTIDRAIFQSQESDEINVIIECKSLTNTHEFAPPPTEDDFSDYSLDSKALAQTILYFLREHITNHNNSLRHIIICNLKQYFIIDAREYGKLFGKDKKILKAFNACGDKTAVDASTDAFYKSIFALLPEIKHTLPFAYFNLEEAIKDESKQDLALIYQLLSPQVLLKQQKTIDANTLNKKFYDELLYILGLEEKSEGGKTTIVRSGVKNTLADAIKKEYESLSEEEIFALLITWNNRVLFLCLLESMLLGFKHIPTRFLNSQVVRDFKALSTLFFEVLAKKQSERDSDLKPVIFKQIPYLNSSLFDKTPLEREGNEIWRLDSRELALYPTSILKTKDKSQTTLPLLEYYLAFLQAYDFTTTPKDIQDNIKTNHDTLINSAVLGLVFEKLNGYKEGSFYTPSFITSYMCEDAINRAIITRFNAEYGWQCKNLEELENTFKSYIGDEDEKEKFRKTFLSIRICDPAVGSGHFLVSALNYLIYMAYRLRISGIGAEIALQNDELLIYHECEIFQYTKPKLSDSHAQKIQQSLFHLKKSIIENCLFGVDINPNSCEITKLRLWIELLKHSYYIPTKEGQITNELQTLPNIDINIKCGNSLLSNHPINSPFATSPTKDFTKELADQIQGYKSAVQRYKDSQSSKSEIIKELEGIKATLRRHLSENSQTSQSLRKNLEIFFNDYGDEVFDIKTDFGRDMLSIIRDKKFSKQLRTEPAPMDKKGEKLLAQIKKDYEILESMKHNNAFEWRFEFPEVLDNDGNFTGFDCVIGNPPYMQVPKGTYSKITYPHSEGQDKNKQNLYKVFIEHAYNITIPDGIFSLIVSHSIMCDLSASFTRKMLLTKTTMHEVIEFPKKAPTKGGQVFESATQGTCIITATKTLPRTNHAFKLSIHNDGNTIKKLEFLNIAQERILEVYENLFEIPFIKNEKELTLIDRLRHGNKTPLKDFIQFSRQGNVNTTCLRHIKSPKRTDIMIVKGEDCHQYNLETNKRYAKPEHPLVIKAIETNINQNIIVLQGITGTTDKIRIHATLLESKNTKIVFLDSVKILFLQNVREAKFILGLLNSKVLDWLFRKTSSNNNVNSYELEALPIPKIDSTNQSIADNIIALVEEILEKKKQDSATDTTKLESQINALVYTLYNLTDEEIELIEKG